MEVNAQNLINTLPRPSRLVAKYINLHESKNSLAHLRFAQDTITNWVPKALFSRSLADFSDMSFLEISESLLVYYGPTLLGEKLFRKLYSNKLTDDLSAKISVRAENLLKDKSISVEYNKKLMPVKAAIAISALSIPLCEYSLNYIKNIFTIKMFKQADFNNIANLSKTKEEDKKNQKQVEKNAINHLKLAGTLIVGCLGLSAFILAGRKKPNLQQLIQKISETILAPGNKIFKNNTEKATKFNEYFSIDFKDNNGKLGLSKGQLMACVLIGGIGYFGAAKDRGKQNFQEVLFRYPLVTFYVITGSELFEKAFRKILKKTDKCKEILNEEKMPTLEKLPELARKSAIKNGTSIESEFKKLFNQKSALIGIPTLFGLIVMGFFVAGYSKIFTQYRYDKENKIQVCK